MDTTSIIELDSNSTHFNQRIRLAIVFAIIGLLGTAKPVIFNGGSSVAKYIAKQSQLKMVDEANVEAVFESAVFGESSSSVDSIEVVDEETQTIRVEQVYTVDAWIAWVLLCCPFLLLIPTILTKTPVYHILLIASIWLFLLAVGSTLNGGKKFSEVAILAHATRWGLPLFIWYVIFIGRRQKASLSARQLGLWILIICSSLTFAVHGVEAWLLNPPFQDLIYSFGRIFGVDISPKVIAVLLRLIGTMDLVFAVLVVWKRSRVVCLRMAMWGFITALSRPVTMGIDAWPEFAMRIANGALPLILFYIYQTRKQHIQQNEPNEASKELTYEEA